MPYYAKTHTQKLIEKLQNNTDARSKREVKHLKYVLKRMGDKDTVNIPSSEINKIQAEEQN